MSKRSRHRQLEQGLPWEESTPRKPSPCIRSFYDTIDHGWLQRFLEHRIGDSRMVRLLMKWAKAGVMEDGKLHEVRQGSPQGAVISPLLANIFLHGTR